MSAIDGRGDLPPEAVEAIERAEREKEEFLSVLVHELKTPLAPLKTVAQLLRSRLARVRSGARELDLGALDRNLATIERQVERMDRLVTDLLEVSRMGRGRFELRPAPFDLALAVHDVVRRWSGSTAEEGRHRFEVDAPPSLLVVADQQRVEQAVGNLIGNAVKFSPRGGVVRVRVEGSDREVAVTVRDDGIGIEAGELPDLGRAPFVRGRRAAGYAGVGVGLYLCRLVAEGHGGRLRVESEGSDKGTTAQLTLPLSLVPEEGLEPSAGFRPGALEAPADTDFATPA